MYMCVLNKERGGYISLIHTLSDSIDGCEMNRKPLPMLPIAKDIYANILSSIDGCEMNRKPLPMLPIAKDIYANIPSVSKVLLPDKLDQPME